jgi:hypothetical protein
VYVDAVLGLSMTPTSFGLVLVEGHDADGATVDRDAFDVEHGPIHTSEQATAAVLRTEAIAATRGIRLHSIGLTWSEDAGDQASQLMRSLSESGFDNVVPIRLPEATEALARGMADVIGYDTTAVCVIEPEAVIALIVHTGDGAVQTAFNHAIDTEESLISWLSTVFTKADWQPEALVVVGSAGGFEEYLPELEDALSVPVFSPAEAELALARGAALASTVNVDLPFPDFAAFAESQSDTTRARHSVARRRPLAQVGALGMLVAGVLTFVVSASVAISLEIAPREQSGSIDPAGAVEAPAAPAPAARQTMLPAAPAIAAPPPAPVAPPPLPEAPTVDVEVPTGDVPVEAPIVEEAPAPEAPAGVLAPDPAAAPPAVAPPPVATQEPSLRSRIMDRLKGINDPEPADVAPPVEPAPPILPGDVPPPVPPVQ